MTDGIIQKVFEKFRKEHPNSLQEGYWLVRINELEQELIKEIKKLFPDSPFRHSNAFIISRLIGDNEK